MKRTIATILAASLTSFTLAQDATTAPAQKAPTEKAMEISALMELRCFFVT